MSFFNDSDPLAILDVSDPLAILDASDPLAILNASSPMDDAITPANQTVLLEMVYSVAEARGVSILIAAAGVSLLAVVGLLGVMGFSAYKTMRTPSVHRFMRTHVVAYFVSLLLCDVISTVGSLMNGQWVSEGGVHLGAFCTSQGALKNTGNVGTALWSLVIAVHTFCLLVLKWRSNDYILYSTLFVVWIFIGLVVIIGPAAVQNLADKGPYFGVAGYWCWITDGYTAQRITLEYFWMFLSAFVSFVLYSMVFLSLRGNIILSGGKLRLRLKRSTLTWEAQTGRDSPDGQAMSLAKHMLAYPIAYTALILPITLCRFLEWAGHDVPFEATIFADTVFMLSGLVNVVLFTTTRKIFPARALFSRSNSSGSDLESQTSSEEKFVKPTPFVLAEKVTVSPNTSGPVFVPVLMPAPAKRNLRQAKATVPKRGASLAPTVASVYSQKSFRQEPVVPSMPKSKSMRQPIRQSAITPLQIVKKASIRNVNSPIVPPAALPKVTPEEREEDLGHRESWSDESSSRYSGSSYCSTAPLNVPAPQSRHQSTTSSMSSSRAPGTRF